MSYENNNITVLYHGWNKHSLKIKKMTVCLMLNTNIKLHESLCSKNILVMSIMP